MGIVTQIKHAWNAFQKPEQPNPLVEYRSMGSSFSSLPGRTTRIFGNDKTIKSTIYNQIGIDVSAIDMFHVKTDPEENFRYVSTIQSGLNMCFNLEANIDETSRAFKQNIVMTMFDKGVVAIVPIDTSTNPANSNVYDIHTMRVGEVLEFMPQHVRVLVYNELTGEKVEMVLSKRKVAVVINPMYAVMNEHNSTLQRLTRKLSLLDTIDEQTSSGKLDLIFQLPYVVKNETRRAQADKRRQEIEDQMENSRYGIVYTDGTEKVTQLNRPAENNMLRQVEYLTKQLYSQLGLTEEVFLGTASETVMLNYFNRTIEPVLSAITQAMERVFLTKTARTQGQAIRFFRDPFKLVGLADIAELADKLTRNEVVTSNEIRGFIGMRPSKDKKADELRNSNMPLEPTRGIEGKVVNPKLGRPRLNPEDKPNEERKENLQNDSDDSS